MMFPLALTVGVAASLLWLGLAEPITASNPESVGRITSQRLQGAFAALITAVIFSRLSFVFLFPAQFSDNPLAALALWHGGLTAWGAALGALLGLAIHSFGQRNSFWVLLDALAGPTCLVALSAWLGCSLDGCAYGRSAVGNLLAIPGPDMMGQIAPRWPTQTGGALGSIALFTIAVFRTKVSWKPGILGITVWQGHALLLLGLSWLRADPVRYFGQLRSDTLGALLMLGAGIVMYILNRNQGEQVHNETI